MSYRSTLLGLLVAVALAVPAWASPVQEIEWEDLSPPWNGPPNPIDELTPDQQKVFYDYLYARDLAKFQESQDDFRVTERHAMSIMRRKGVDADALMAKVEAYDREIEAHYEMLVEGLNGKTVKLAGYALPLDYQGTTIKEFLLVPYIGACIHTPPPPTNQIVHVQAAEGFESDEPFTPVWVTGRMSTTQSTQSLSFVDGTSDISVGYRLDASLIEPYEGN